MTQQADTASEVQALRRQLDEAMTELRHLRDRQVILEAVRRHARGYDRNDRDLMASAYWPDAQVNYGDWYSGEPQGMITWGNAFVQDRTVARLHHITTQTVEIDGDVAHAETYVIWTMLSPEKVANIGSGRYIDKLERRNGEWRISIREFFGETTANVPASADPTAMAGTQDRSDLSYARPLKRRPE